jgi:hypothetical protein
LGVIVQKKQKRGKEKMGKRAKKIKNRCVQKKVDINLNEEELQKKEKIQEKAGEKVKEIKIFRKFFFYNDLL